MYDWLGDARQENSAVVTANRRLARVLQEQFATQQLRAGRTAWRSPAIHAWPDWLSRLAESSSDQHQLPVRLNRYQSQLLWERCLDREFEDNVPGGLVRMAQDAWKVLCDWRIPIRDVARSAQNDDQRRFARVAGRYLAILERDGWVDESGLAGAVVEGIESGSIAVPASVTFAGFDRDPPILTALAERLTAGGATIGKAPARAGSSSRVLFEFENSESEFRAAGCWARHCRPTSRDRPRGS